VKKAPAKQAKTLDAAGVIAAVSAILRSYAERGVFRGFAHVAETRGRAVFKIEWHRNRSFELHFDPAAGTLHFPSVLPAVPARSPMDRHFRKFAASRQSEEVVAHRRIDPARAELRCTNRGGSLGVTIEAHDGDIDYATRKLIHFVHEVYLDFLYDGRYHEYMIETFDLDPDRM
jgi:hypothetical protein